MSNLYAQLRKLLPAAPLQVGQVLASADGVCRLELPGGGIAQARGEAEVGTKVFFRDGVIEGPAPDLPVEVIEV